MATAFLPAADPVNATANGSRKHRLHIEDQKHDGVEVVGRARTGSRRRLRIRVRIRRWRFCSDPALRANNLAHNQASSSGVRPNATAPTSSPRPSSRMCSISHTAFRMTAFRMRRALLPPALALRTIRVRSTSLRDQNHSPAATCVFIANSFHPRTVVFPVTADRFRPPAQTFTRWFAIQARGDLHSPPP